MAVLFQGIKQPFQGINIEQPVSVKPSNLATLSVFILPLPDDEKKHDKAQSKNNVTQICT